MGSNPGSPTVSFSRTGQLHVWVHVWDDPFVFERDTWDIIPGIGIKYYVDDDNKHISVLPLHKIEKFDILYE